MASTTLISSRCFEWQHVDKTRKSSKTNLIYEGSSCNLCNQPMVWLCPAGIKQKSPIQKTVLSFHNYEKKVNRKTNKIRQVIDDPKKNIKCSGKKRSKKIDSRNEGKEKQETYVFDEKTWFETISSHLFRKKFSPIAVGERNVFSYKHGYIIFTVKQRD